MNIRRFASMRAKLARALTLAVIAIVALTSAAAAADLGATAQFKPVGGARELKGAPGIYEWVFQATVGNSPFDKIALHRLTRDAATSAQPDAVVLYLPGTNMNGEVALEDSRYSFQVYLATQGVDVWTMDYRTHFIPPATPEKDLAELAKWTNNLFESDIDNAAAFVRSTTAHEKTFVAGFSRGVEFAYLYAAMHPDRVRGIIALDGSIPLRAMRTVAPGNYADDVAPGKNLTFEKRKVLLQMVIANPNGPAPIPKFKTARENLEYVVYSAGGFFGGKGGLANPQGGYSDATVLAPLLLSYDRWWPAVQDGEAPFTPELLTALKTSKIPVIAFASTNFGAQWPAMAEQSAKSTGDPNPQFHKFEDWGHLDVLAGTKAEKEVFAPTLEWIKQHQK